MHSIKWLVVVVVAFTAAIADVFGHTNLAIALGIVATIAMLGALELGAALEEDDGDGLTVERLALVLVYAWSASRAGRFKSRRGYVDYCRRAAIGLEQAVSHGPR